MVTRLWAFGDRLVHASRPEWGGGVVTSAQRDSANGKQCQKLVIRFDRAGVKTISTAHADLRPESDMPLHTPYQQDNADPFLAPLGPSPKEIMLKIPDNASDPFATARSRLDATLKLFRFSEQGASLLDWAVMQSGLRDPMTRFNRHELEDLFKRWMMLRDEHTKKLVLEIKRTEPALLGELGPTAPRSAQQLLRRLDALR